ncbi:MAG: hypothetical protein JWM09_833 [Francisellaceae bacterium]|nr:hypothetical protein [Francisellaceae bacterium]
MPTSLGLALISEAGILDFCINSASEMLPNFLIDIKDTQDLSPICDAINAASENIQIKAELKDIIDSKGNTIKTCILISEADSIEICSLNINPKTMEFKVFQPGILEFYSLGVKNQIWTLVFKNTAKGLDIKVQTLTALFDSPDPCSSDEESYECDKKFDCESTINGIANNVNQALIFTSPVINSVENQANQPAQKRFSPKLK